MTRTRLALEAHTAGRRGIVEFAEAITWRQTRRFVCFVTAFALFVGAWLYLAGESKRVCAEYPGASIRVTGVAPQSETVLRALREYDGTEITSVTAWSRSEVTEIVNEPLSKSTKARIVCVAGDMRFVEPMELLSGFFPQGDDYTGCVLEKTAAYALFGTINATGAQVTINGKSFTVRGVYSGTSNEPCAMLRGGTQLENFEFACRDVKNAKYAAEDFMFRYSLCEDYVTIENGLWADLFQKYANLPAWVAAVWAVVLLIKKSLSLCTKPLERVLVWVGAALAMAGVCFALKVQIYIPQRLLPTRWSDFAGFSQIWDEIGKNSEQLSWLTPLGRDRAFTAALWRMGMAMIVGIASAGIAMHGLKRRLQR